MMGIKAQCAGQPSHIAPMVFVVVAVLAKSSGFIFLNGLFWCDKSQLASSRSWPYSTDSTAVL
jgi:hypothetical protein